jgi:hypothetical protein
MDRTSRVTGLSLAILLGLTGSIVPAVAQTCAGKAISCGQTIDGEIGSGSCTDANGNRYDAYTFDGVAGEEVLGTISSSIANVAVLAAIIDSPIEGPAAFNKVSPVGLAAAEGGSAQFSVTLDQTSPDWYFMVAATTPGLKFLASTAPYTLSVACSGLTGCTAGPQTLCLLGGRFKVQATYAASTGQAGQANTVTASDDTGLLWFYDATNIEAVVKMIDGCSLGGHYWFFAGGLTNSRVVLTVTDTKTNLAKRYVNPQNQAFEPIQDTSAFATCP